MALIGQGPAAAAQELKDQLGNQTMAGHAHSAERESCDEEHRGSVERDLTTSHEEDSKEDMDKEEDADLFRHGDKKEDRSSGVGTSSANGGNGQHSEGWQRCNRMLEELVSLLQDAFLSQGE